MLSGGKGIEGLYIYTIPGIGIPDNEDWETNGKAPWEGWEETDERPGQAFGQP